MNVILIGFRGSGKSTIGKAISERLGREFIDCDEWIEKHTELTIKEIFEKHGESHFRTLESQAIGELSAMEGKVRTPARSIASRRTMPVVVSSVVPMISAR